MSQPAGLAGRFDAETRLGGTARVLLGFIVGALVALVPMYYYQASREAARGADEAPLAGSAEPRDAARESPGTRTATKPFASRLTYELSRPPDERPVSPPKAVPAVASAPVLRPPPPAVPAAKGPAAALAPAPPASSVVAAPPPPAERVANARPISIQPPDPRDRTAEIEREARKPEYREPPRTQAKPRIFEGREIELKPAAKPVEAAARSGPADGSPAVRPAESESERVAGVAPIKPPAQADTKPAKADKSTKADKPVKPPAKADVPVKPSAKAESTVVAKAPAAAPAVPVERAEIPGSAPGAGSDVESRLDATRGWLAAAPPTTHTIQLMGTNSEEQLKAQLKALSKVVEPTKLYVYRTKAQGKPSITVVYGAYADRQSAMQALEKLPAAITANKPVLRTVNGIRTEMKQHHTEAE